MTENTEVALNKEQLETALKLLEGNDISSSFIYIGKAGFKLLSMRTHKGANTYGAGYWVYDLINEKGKKVHSAR